MGIAKKIIKARRTRETNPTNAATNAWQKAHSKLTKIRSSVSESDFLTVVIAVLSADGRGVKIKITGPRRTVQ